MRRGLVPAFLAPVLALVLGARAAQAIGTNVLPNPDFDVDTAPWSFAAANGGLGTGGPDAEDADGCGHSGSLTGISTTGGTYYVVATACAPAAASPARVWVQGKLISSAGPVSAYLIWDFFNTYDCSGTQIDGSSSPSVVLSDSTWNKAVSGFFNFGFGEHSARIKLVAFSGSGSFTVLFDRAFLGSAAEIFVDDFEIQDYCRW